MRVKKQPEIIERKTISAEVDIRISSDLRKLSKEIGKPVYVMIEEALNCYILRQRKFHKTRLEKQSKS